MFKQTKHTLAAVVSISGVQVKGVGIDERTGCIHYRSSIDVIAIKFPCCNVYYACYACHTEIVDHAPQRWPSHRFTEKAILCGLCGVELTIDTYLSKMNRPEGPGCPNCGGAFNPGCSKHHPLYFELDLPAA